MSSIQQPGDFRYVTPLTCTDTLWSAAYQDLTNRGAGVELTSETSSKVMLPFLQWQLDSVRPAPVPIKLNESPTPLCVIKMHAKQVPRHDLVICYGAGIDSTIAAAYAKQLGYDSPLLIQISYGATYDDKEREAGRKTVALLRKRHGTLKLLEVDVTPLPCEGNMPKGYIVPLRNALLASIAADVTVGSDPTPIWIVSNYRKIDDGVGAATDKGRRFFGEISEILSRFHSAPIMVSSPFLHLSKAQTITKFLGEMGGDPAVLSATTTCYHATEHRCAACFACFKLAMSLKLCDVSLPGFSLERVERQPGFLEYIKREQAKGRTLPEDWARLAGKP